MRHVSNPGSDHLADHLTWERFGIESSHLALHHDEDLDWETFVGASSLPVVVRLGCHPCHRASSWYLGSIGIDGG